MNQEKAEFLERKKRVMDQLQQSITFLKDNGYEEEASILSKQYANVENEEFVITVVGEFSSGKSYLLNALMGDMLLPSYSGEATAKVNFLRHKDKAKNGEGGCIYYKDGRTETIASADKESIEQYVCTRGDESETADIDHVDIFVESKFLEDNVTLVDTPGLNGLRAGLEDLTRKQIEESSASIFLFNAKQPGSETDFNTLAMLRRKVNSIFLVLTQADLIDKSSGESVESIVDTLKEKYRKDFPEETELTTFHPVSAKMALVGRSDKKIELFGRTDFSPEEKERLIQDSGMPKFEDYLFKFLTKGEKGKQILLAPVVQLDHQLDKVFESIKMEYGIWKSGTDIQQLDDKCKELEDALKKLRGQIEEKTGQIQKTLKSAEIEFREELEAQADLLTKRYVHKIEEFTDVEDIRAESIRKGLDTALRKLLEDAMDSYSGRLEEILTQFHVELDQKLTENTDVIGLEGLSSPKLEEIQLTTLDSGMEVFEKELTELRRENEALRKKADDAEDAIYEKRKLDLERKKIEKKIERYENDMADYRKNAMINMPNIVKVKRGKEVYQERDGFIGGIVDKVGGRRKQTIYEDVVDSSAREAHKKEMNEVLSEYNRDIEALKGELQRYQGNDPAAAERAEKRLRNMYHEKRQRELDLQKEFAEKIRKTCEKQLRIQKEEIAAYVEEGVEELKKETKDYFNKSRGQRTMMIVAMATGALNEAVKEKEREIETVKRRTLVQENEREQRMAQLESQKAALRKLCMSAKDLKDELEAIATVNIE